ncbi:hypothetical protein [Subtercola boreus]|uniref:hypothetical protein n=1 Tax=Subtercola boreus TaxID=120213 RepID=UPI00209C6B05|nr:hypothetical protein [Subtercola boreus]
MLPMWKVSSTARGIDPRVASPLATRATGPVPTDAATTVPGTAKVIELVRYDERHVETGADITAAKAASAPGSADAVGEGAGAVDVAPGDPLAEHPPTDSSTVATIPATNAILGRFGLGVMSFLSALPAV